MRKLIIKRNSINSKSADLSNITLVVPILMYRHFYFIHIKEYYWSSTLLCSGYEAIFYASIWLFFFILIWIVIYYKIYNFYLEKFKPIVFIYLIINPFWIIFYYLIWFYVKNEASEKNSTWILICIIIISIVSLKLYNMAYIKILKYLASKKEV